MSKTKNNFRGLLITAGVILAALVGGYLTGYQDTILDILLATGLILLGITLLVTVHELGHFLTARMFGMRVDAFSIGFPPKIFGIKRGDTEYQIGATPLGGYVKIAGMIDESLDADYVENPPQSFEFRSKPVWQRLIVMLGGVVMNVLLGIFIFSMMKFLYGERRIPMEEVNKYGVEVYDGSIGSILGFQTGDRPLEVNGEKGEYLEDYFNLSPLQESGYYLVERQGAEVRVDIPDSAINFFAVDTLGRFLFVPNMPAIVTLTEDSIVQAGPAALAGLQTGDQIIRLDSTPIETFSDLRDYVQKKNSSELQVSYLRDGVEKQTQVTLGEDKKMYVWNDWRSYYQQFQITKEYDFISSFGPGTVAAFGVVTAQAKGLARLPQPGVEARKLLQGPLQIAKMLLEWFKDDKWRGFFQFTGILSMILALMNILPIPALDGGHVVFLLYEAVTRKEPSVKVRLIAQQVGMILVLGLMVAILFNDAFRLIFG